MVEIQFKSFVSSQYKSAELYSLILTDYKYDQNFRDIIDCNTIVHIKEIQRQKNHFCKVLSQSDPAKEILGLKKLAITQLL